jgi:hypothetical protein
MSITTQVIRNFELFAICLATLFLTGCETPKFEKHAAQVPSAYSLSRDVEGVAVGIEPITDQADLKRYFDVNLHHANILPVFVVISNHNPSASCLVSSESFAIVNGKFEAAGGNVNHTRLEANLGLAFLQGALNPTGGGVIGGFAGMFTANALAESDHNLQNQNLRQETLRKKTLSPGASTQGYVFFPIPKPKERASEWVVLFKSTFLGQATNNTAAFSFQWTSP